MTYRYLNLTNGLEWLQEFPDALPIRIPSTYLEKCDWAGVFLELDAGLLFRLATGQRCIIYDCGCRREVSKTISVGVPTIRACLNAFWHGDCRPSVYPGLFEYRAGCDVETLKRIKRKYAYYRKFLVGTGIRLQGVSRATTRDGDRAYYATLVGNKE